MQEFVGVGPMMGTVELTLSGAWVLSVEGSNMPLGAEFLPLDSVL